MCQKRYRGETGFNAHARLETHEKQIRGSVQANSVAPHLTEEQPARRRDPTTFNSASGWRRRESGLCRDRFARLRRLLMRLLGG